MQIKGDLKYQDQNHNEQFIGQDQYQYYQQEKRQYIDQGKYPRKK